MPQLRAVRIWALRLARFAGRVLAAFLRNRGILLAGGVGYNALLSLVPFLIVVVAAMTLVFDRERVLAVVAPELGLIVPQHADVVLQTVDAFLESLPATGLVSLAVLVLFSSIAFRMLEEAVAVIFHGAGHTRRRSFWVSALLPYLFQLVTLMALFFTTLVASVLDALGQRPLHVLGVVVSLERPVHLALRLATFVGLVAIFSGIYHVLPVVKVSAREAIVAGLCAAILWRIAGLAMAYYFAHISMVNAIYGSLGTVIVLLLGMEIAFTVLLLGVQVIAELEASAAAGVPWYQKPAQAPGYSEGEGHDE